jgi:asparagine synthase (glutamine-hydrolysing)
MCGIAGIINYNPIDGNQLYQRVRSMVQTIGHRGPDDSGIWKNEQGNVCFGHARLSIIDLSDEGKQPKASFSGNYIITFNGEIYNYIEMRKELSSAGVFFHGTSDTEVLLSAIEKWGINKAIKKANGMFALAVLDINNRKIWFARDRAGKKPLYIYKDSNQFIFSSEIKGILSVPNLKVTISQQSLNDYLSVGFVIGTDTIYKEIKEVQPGILIEFDLINRTTQESTYWKFPTQTPLSLSKFEIQSETEKYLKDSINIRLRADVPVGVFLSGGIDSGLITAMAAQQVDYPLKTFTVGFNDGTFDETSLARQVAKRYSTEHHEIFLDPDLEDLLPKVVRAYDEPFADPSALPTFAIAKEAAKYVKVVLNGEGSDELFGGYRRALAIQMLNQLSFLTKRLPKNSYNFLLKNMPIPKGFRSTYSWLYRFLRGMCEDKYVRYINWSMDGFDEYEKKQMMLNKHYNQSIPTDQIIRKRMMSYDHLSDTSNFMAIDFLIGMADCLLPKVDIATMSHGLESRSPFLDYRLVEWVSQIDKKSLLSLMKTKPILRSLSNDYLPQAIVNAPKRGFEIPLVKWMKYDLNNMLRDVCMSQNSILFDFFEKRAILNLLDHRLPLDDERWAKRVWPLFMFALWGQTIDENRLRIT